MLAPAPAQAVQREGLARQLDGSGVSVDLIIGGASNYIVPRSALVTAACALAAVENPKGWAAGADARPKGWWR